MSIHKDVIRFDKDVSEASFLLNSIKQLINQRSNAINEQKQTLNIDSELRNTIAKLKGESIPSLEKLCGEIQRNPLSFNITKQECERRTNMLFSIKTQFAQCEPNAFARRPSESSSRRLGQQTLFNGRGNNDIEMQDLGQKTLDDQSEFRKRQWQEQEEGLREVNDLTEQLIQGNKLIGSEIDKGNVVLDQIGDRTDKVNERMLTLQDKFENLLKTTSNNTLWIVIIANIFIMVALIAL